jgi:hypothetical protein
MILLAALLCNYGRGKCLIDVGTEGYVILDRDSKFDDEVITFLTATGLKPWVVCTIATRGAKRHRLSSTRLLSV